MTDKQIIIDSVDVKKCVYHESGYCTISKEAYCYCCDKPNCHYKNWQRKEQECDELAYENYELNELFDRLKAENDELKKKCNIYTCGICGNKEDCNKLYKTLTEIKEIAEINPINTCWTVLELCEKCDENKECDIQCPLFKFKLILQKISECEGNNEN